MYKEFYKSSKFVSITDVIETKNVVGTNNCNIKILNLDNGLLVISTIDNLIKGGSGQAVQNFNIMNGLGEDIGLG